MFNLNSNFYQAVYETLMACGWSNGDADMFCDMHCHMGNKAIPFFTKL